MRDAAEHIRDVSRRRSARTPGANSMTRRAVLGFLLTAPMPAILALSTTGTARSPAAATPAQSPIPVVAGAIPASTPAAALPATPVSVPPEPVPPPAPPIALPSPPATAPAPPPSPAIDRSASQAPPTPRPQPRPGPSRLDRVERQLDASGWGWREAGVTVRIGFHPRRCCHWGVYDFNDRTLWVSSGAFVSDRRLRYVTLHELAHAWQWTSGRLDQIAQDMTAWALTGRPAVEAHADCIAAHWGAGQGHYWTCPPDALGLVARRLAGDWQ